jgi:hypothetical protein
MEEIHLLFETSFLFEQDIGRDGLQTCGNRERDGVRKLQLKRVRSHFSNLARRD